MEKNKNSIKEYLKKELDNYIKMLKDDKELFEQLKLKEKKYAELNGYINNMQKNKTAQERFKICIGSIITILCLMGIELFMSGINQIMWLGVFVLAFSAVAGVLDVAAARKYYENKNKLKQNNFDMNLLEELELGYSKFQKLMDNEVVFPLRKCEKRICEYEKAINALSSILQSDALAKAIEENLEYDFVKEALQNEWESYIQEIAKIKPEDYHYRYNPSTKKKCTMKKLTAFIDALLKNGNAKLIETTDEENVYRITVCQYLEKLGYQKSFTYTEEYDQPLIINGEINPDAKLVSKEDIKDEDFLQLLCRLVKNNLSSNESVIQSDSNPLDKTKVYSLEQQALLNNAEQILGMSNHSIVCCIGTDLDYLEKYLIEEVIRNTNCSLTEQKNISSIGAAEDDLMNRIEHIIYLATRIQSEGLTKEEYASISSEWIKLYEDRQFHGCPSNGKSEEKKRNLSTTNK